MSKKTKRKKSSNDVEECLDLLLSIAQRDAAAVNDDPAKDALCLSVQTAIAIAAERRRAEAVMATWGVLEDQLQADRHQLSTELHALKKKGGA